MTSTDIRQTVKEPKEVTFCIGSNCEDREANVRKGLMWLSSMLSDFRHSSVYATPDCHGEQREYMNAVAIGFAGLEKSELERICKEFEKQCGRDATAREAGNVPLDIDLVIVDDIVLRKKDYACEFFLKGYRQLKQSSHPICQ